MWRGIHVSGGERLHWLERVRRLSSWWGCCSEHLFLMELLYKIQRAQECNRQLASVKAQLQRLLAVFLGPTWPTLLEASQNCSQSLFNHSVKIIRRVSAFDSVSVCQTLPFSLCVVQHCISQGYPPQDSNNTTSWWKLKELFFPPFHFILCCLSLW